MIALIGEPGNGKTTIAQALAQELGWYKVSFADPLRQEVAYALAGSDARKSPEQIVREMVDPDTKDKYRGILQWWGTEYRRADDPDYWIRVMSRQLISGKGYVIDDCRFDNEHDLLCRKGFKFVLLESGETTRPVQSHASEVDWKSWTPDLILSYEKGPEHQAKRIIEYFKLNKVLEATG